MGVVVVQNKSPKLNLLFGDEGSLRVYDEGDDGRVCVAQK